MVAPEHAEWYRALRQLPLFDGIPNDELEGAILSGDADVRSYYRDDVVADEDSVRQGGTRIFLMIRGQVALAVFDAAVLTEEKRASAGLSLDDKKKKVRTAPPMIGRAEKNLATFNEGELWNSSALPGAGAHADRRRAAFYAVEPADLVAVAPGRMAHLTSRYPFFADRLRRAVQIAKGRLAGLQGIKQEIFDFYVRHGLSVAETLRVRQVDKCIECKECEKACESRYGHKRLTIHGPRMGMLDFVYACRTCVDQRCIDPCNFDAIKFDGQRGEVLIDEASCTGCAACATACPYGSIEMVDLQDPAEKRLKLRLDKSGALEWGDGTKRKAALTKIASKCDHCAGYGDQACISHCPTGALIEIRPADVFHDAGDVARAGARSGFEHTVMVDPNSVMPDDAFRKGLGVSNFGAAKVKRKKIPRGLLWSVALGAFALCALEVVLRLFWPSHSFQYAAMRLHGVEPGIALLKVGYKPGSSLAVAIGIAGTSLLAISLLYPLRKQVKLLQRLGSSAGWFDLHLLGGIVGPLFITLHGAMKLDNWVSIGYWSMIIIVLSGLVGRYLSVQLPEVAHGGELDELEEERKLAQLRAAHPAAAGAIQMRLDQHRMGIERLARDCGMWRALTYALVDDFLRRPFRRMSLFFATRHAHAPFLVRRRMARIADQLMLATRRRLLVPRTQSVLSAWKKVHVPFAVMLALVAIVHISMALAYSM